MTALTLGLAWTMAVAVIVGQWRRPVRRPSPAAPSWQDHAGTPRVRDHRRWSASARASPRQAPEPAGVHAGGLPPADHPAGARGLAAADHPAGVRGLAAADHPAPADHLAGARGLAAADHPAPARGVASDHAGRVAGARADRWSPVTALGAWLRRRAGRSPDAGADRRVGWALVCAVGLAVLAPPLALIPPAWAVLTPVLASRQARRAHEATITDQLPDVVDLLAVTTAAGLPIAAALCAIGHRPGGPLGAALGRAASHIEWGGTTADALALVLDCAGPSTRTLVEALADHDRYGTPLGPALERVAIESRLRRRRRAEEAARRLPVTLLFPLVLTTLPAFALLTVVPLLAGSFGSLSP